jgi:hypothetical protein
MEEAYAMLRRMIQLTNKVFDFPFRPRTPASISECENAILILHQEVLLFRTRYDGMEIKLGGPGIKALEAALFAASYADHGPLLHAMLEGLSEGVLMAKRLPYGLSGLHNLHAATRREKWGFYRPSLKALDELDAAYQAWLSKQSVSAAQIESAVAPKKSEAVKAKVKRDKLQEARDKWIYQQCCKGTAHDTIARNISNKNPKWGKISTKQGVLVCARRYAKRKGLPDPPPRQER